MDFINGLHVFPSRSLAVPATAKNTEENQIYEDMHVYSTVSPQDTTDNKTGNFDLNSCPAYVPTTRQEDSEYKVVQTALAGNEPTYEVI